MLELWIRIEDRRRFGTYSRRCTRILRQSFPEQHLDVGLVAQAFLGSQSSRRFQVFLRNAQRYRLRGLRSTEQVAQRQWPLLFHPLADFRLDFGTMRVPPRGFLRLTREFWDDHLLHFRFCHVYSSPHCSRYRAAVSLSAVQPVIGRIASRRTAKTMLSMRPARVAPTASQRCSFSSI
jgi:hypothetical protein